MVIGDRKEEGLVVLWLVVEFKGATESQPMGCEGRRHGCSSTFPSNHSLRKVRIFTKRAGLTHTVTFSSLKHDLSS